MWFKIPRPLPTGVHEEGRVEWSVLRNAPLRSLGVPGYLSRLPDGLKFSTNNIYCFCRAFASRRMLSLRNLH